MVNDPWLVNGLPQIISIGNQAGRLHRHFQGKEKVCIYDYFNANVPVLEMMYKRQLKTYKAVGYEIQEV